MISKIRLVGKKWLIKIDKRYIQ